MTDRPAPVSRWPSVEGASSFPAFLHRSRRIDLEHRLQAAVGDHYRILKELGGTPCGLFDLARLADADPELQPGVREVRTRLARLATETPS